MFNTTKTITLSVLFSIFVLIVFMTVYNYITWNLNLCLEITSYNYFKSEFNFVYGIIFISMILVLLIILLINKQILIKNGFNVIFFIVFAVVLYFLIFTNSIIIFFLMYELLLLLTAIILNFFSQNIRAKLITLYFIFWTQLSSFFLWLSTTFVLTITNSYTISTINTILIGDYDLLWIKSLLFLSFGIKIPVWPFSFWLIKTHVEVNTSFSIFLSGVLVKTALIGFMKYNIFFIHTNNFFLIYLILVSLMFTALSLNSQMDLKKLIAYLTIQEMSLITIFIFYNNYINMNIILYFIIFHTILSLLLFYFNELIYVRFQIRKVRVMLGLALLTPKLNNVLIAIWLFVTGLPLTFKFFFEFFIILKVVELHQIVFVSILILLQLITVVFFTNNFITYSFGNGLKTTYDLSKNELLIICSAFLIIILLTL